MEPKDGMALKVGALVRWMGQGPANPEFTGAGQVIENDGRELHIAWRLVTGGFGSDDFLYTESRVLWALIEPLEMTQS